MRLIDADALIFDIENNFWDHETVDGISARLVLRQTVKDIRNYPTVDAVPVVHGRWVVVEEGQNTSVYQCSKCNRMVNVVCDQNLRKRQLAKKYPYCNCGAKMDLEVE